jgi:hypothetical protein
MSVDLYVSVSAANWPTSAAVQQCMASHSYPVTLKRFPALVHGQVVTEGALATADGHDAYLEGDLAVASVISADVKGFNDRLEASGSLDLIRPNDAIMSIRTRSPAELRAASYVISALIICFDGFGFETQGNANGRADFAQSLVSGAEALREF